MYHRPRLIPCLTIINRELVKTTQFKKPRYLGDPINSVKIFNGKGVDELCILDIRATADKKGPDFEYLKDIASEAFMPLSYGGGITTMKEIETLFYIGYEKVIINSAFVANPNLIKEAAAFAGSQSIVVAIDVKNQLLGGNKCYTHSGQEKLKYSPQELAKMAESYGAGEILLNSIAKDGTMSGYDLELIKSVSETVKVPVVACGGAGKLRDIKDAIVEGGAHAASAGSFFVYYGEQKAVLINAPTEKELFEIGLYKDYPETKDIKD